ncbi:MAG: riboflavin kinase, partial [Bacteroidales bacterium]
VQHEAVSSTKIRKAISEGYIQRANAYLDHYYMIMGIPEKYEFPGFEKLPSFLKIPITEECKILPATGIYAVSFVNENKDSKGMALICQDHHEGSVVLVNIFDNDQKFMGRKSTMLFHKMIHGTVNLSDPNIADRLQHAKNEISELIY